VSIDFAFAQARAQARVGERISEAGWRVLESLPGLMQYLTAVRNTVLAPHVRHFSAAVTTHAIERTLRDDWRSEVAAVGHWVPEQWVPALAWTAWLPYLDAVAWLIAEHPAPAWMHEDTVLRELATDEPAARRLAIIDSPFGVLADEDANTQTAWFEQWRALCPPTDDDESAGLEALIAAIARYIDSNHGRGRQSHERRDAHRTLDTFATGLMHRRIEEPVVVLCHLLLVALDLLRLRDGLLRRALFRDDTEERAA